VSKSTNRKRKVKLAPKVESPTTELAQLDDSETSEILLNESAEESEINKSDFVAEPAHQHDSVQVEPKAPEKVIRYELTPAKPITLDFEINPELARKALMEVTEVSHIGKHISTQPTSKHTAIVTFEAQMPGYPNWNWLVMLSWLDKKHLTIDEVAMVPTEDSLIAPAWIPWSDRVQAGDLGVGDELPYRANDPALAPGYVAAELDVLDEQDTLRPFWWSLGLGRARVLSPTGRELTANRWSLGEFSGSAIMAKVAQGSCLTCGYFNPLAGSLGSAFGACTNVVSPADGKVVAADFGCGAHSETDTVEEPIATIDLVYDDTYDQGISVDGADNDENSEN
jgi:hypothetical protein